MTQPELGNKVLELRQRKGLTQAELAEKCSLSLRTIQRIEALEVTPRNYTVRAILSCLGYEPEEPSQDASNGKAGRNGFRNRIERPVKFIQELFNLKTNTMKKLSVLSLFAVSLFAGVFLVNTNLKAQKQDMKAASESLVGVWQQVVIDPVTGAVGAYSPYLKAISSDGTYVFIIMREGEPAYFGATGKWKVTSGDTFLEHVDPSSYFVKRTERQTFNIKQQTDGTFMYSKFHTVGTRMKDIEEVWKKCEGIPPVKSK